jgi:hypothetical protein
MEAAESVIPGRKQLQTRLFLLLYWQHAPMLTFGFQVVDCCWKYQQLIVTCFVPTACGVEIDNGGVCPSNAYLLCLMQQNTSSETDSSSASCDIPHLLRNPQMHYRAHSSLPVPAHSNMPYSFRIYLTATLSRTSESE